MLYPITLDVLVTVFSRHGQGLLVIAITTHSSVLKIITFAKGGTFQALMQLCDVQTGMSSPLDLISAILCKSVLHLQFIYTGCCQLHISFSKLKEVVVKYNDEKSRLVLCIFFLTSGTLPTHRFPPTSKLCPSMSPQGVK
jgi:hypothetical protein